MPARFRFRLEPLLRLRKNLEEEAQRQLAKEIENRNQAENSLKSFQAKHKDCVDSRRCQPGEAIDLLRWTNLERFLVVLERQIIHAGEALREADGRVAQARQHLTKAHKDYLTLLRLKERKQLEHHHEILQQEIRESDEIAVLRYRFAGTGSTDSSAPGGAP